MRIEQLLPVLIYCSAHFETGCIFENFTPKQGNSLKIVVAGTVIMECH